MKQKPRFHKDQVIYQCILNFKEIQGCPDVITEIRIIKRKADACGLKVITFYDVKNGYLWNRKLDPEQEIIPGVKLLHPTPEEALEALREYKAQRDCPNNTNKVYCYKSLTYQINEEIFDAETCFQDFELYSDIREYSKRY